MFDRNPMDDIKRKGYAVHEAPIARPVSNFLFPIQTRLLEAVRPRLKGLRVGNKGVGVSDASSAPSATVQDSPENRQMYVLTRLARLRET